MGKVFGILLFVFAIWMGLQYYVGDGSPPAAAEPEQHATRPAQRVGERVQHSLDEGAARQEALMPGSD